MLRDRLLKQVHQLNEELESLRLKLKAYSQEELDQNPNDGGWSPSQILQHLLLSEKLSLDYCVKKVSFEPRLKKANILTWLNGRLVTWSLQSPFKFKAPAVVSSEHLLKEEPVDELFLRWKQLREQLEDFLRHLPSKYVDREVYKHPLGMRLSLRGMLDFYKSHFRRHRKQLLSRLP